VVGEPEGEASDEVLGEGSYYLMKLGLTAKEVAEHFELSPARVSRLARGYSAKLKSGEVVPSEMDRVFWEDVKKEAEGDEKLTFVSAKGFHHAWKSELRRLDGVALMSIFEASKDFMGTDPNKRFLDFPRPKGYDPLAMDREVNKSIEVLSQLLAEKWKEENREKDSLQT